MAKRTPLSSQQLWHRSAALMLLAACGTPADFELGDAMLAVPPLPSSTTARALSCTDPAALLVVNLNNGGNVRNNDSGIRTALEDLGYSVTVLDDNAVTVDDRVDMNLVVVTDTASESAVGTIFNDVDTPVLSLRGAFMTTLGMTSSHGRPNRQRRVQVVDWSHSMAAGQSGLVDVYTGNARVSWGAPSAAAAVVAHQEGQPSRAVIFGYEAGAQMVSGTAPARRAGAFVVQSHRLTSQGRSLLEAAIQWTAGLENGCTAPPCYEDQDDDGYGSDTTVDSIDCDNVGEANASGDCDDSSAAVFPGATEIANDGIDQNCDGIDLTLSGCGSRAGYLVVGDAGELSPGELVVQDRIAAMGHSVTPLDDADASGASYAGIDFIVISSTVNAGRIQSDLTPLNVPLLSWDTALCNELDFSTGGGKPLVHETTVDIVDPAHPMAGGLSGNVTISAAQTRLHQCDPEGSATIVVSSEGGEPLAFAYDAGATMSGGATAPARRAGFFFSDDTASLVNGAGLQLLDAALQWTACGGSTATTTCFADVDNDGFGSDDTVTSADEDCNDLGEAESNGDCDDGNDAVFPGAQETPDDGIDQDCDGVDATSGGCIDGTEPECDGGGGSNSTCGEVLLVVGFIGNPDLGDQAAKARLESQGWIVTYADDDTVTATDALDASLVYVSGTVSPTKIGAMFTDLPVPLISTERSLYDDLGMSLTNGNAIGDESLVVVGSHPMTAGLSGETLVMPGVILHPWGSPVVPHITVAHAVGEPSEKTIFAFDAGDEMDNGVAPARRVGLFAYEPDRLTTEGWALFDAAISWATSSQDPTSCGGECFVDADGDGFGGTTPVPGGGACTGPNEAPNSEDCDDGDAATNPNGADIPDDGVDQDCSGTDAITCFVDADGDGFGSSSTVVSADDDCTDPGEAEVGGDCNDSNSGISPDATDVPDDGIDQDCSGTDAVTCFADGDGDGFGASTLVSVDDDCQDPGEADVGGDCNDGDDGISPGATEVPDDGIDQDCSGTDSVTCFADGDGDGLGAGNLVSTDDDCTDPGEADVGGDCNDGDSGVSPGANEIPDDGVDQDCSGSDSVTCFDDSDGDGFGAGTLVSVDNDCTDPGESATGGDCDDSDGGVSPGATEVPDDGIDQDCSGTDSVTCFADGDGDGFGSGSLVSTDDDCTDPGEAPVGGDCNDGDSGVSPGATEVPDDGVDQDCSGTDAVTCFADSDGDGFGAGTLVSVDDDCTDPGEAAVGGDCNDDDSGVSPGATEVTDDGIDQDCSGTDAITCLADADGDGFGGTGTVVSTDDDCQDPGEATVGGDCNDGDSGVSPGATEIPDDGVDQDCSGTDSVTCFADADGDGFGSGTVVSADDDCEDPGEAAVGGDCNDNDGGVSPDATEVPDDGVDQDCSGTDSVTCFADADGDGFGFGTVVSMDDDCLDMGESQVGGDCDDSDGAVSPGASEIPDDGVDQDCSGTDSVTCFVDSDGDGFGTSDTIVSADDDCDDPGETDTTGDCNDGDGAVSPGAQDQPGDGVDQDCNGVDAITCFADSDGDGVGGTDTVVSVDADCSDPGESDNTDDCDDSNATVFPGATEVVGDGVDQDCNGTDAIECFADQDGDGFGGASTVVALDGDCDDPGEADAGGDCNDDNASAFPGATEVPGNGADEDCDGFDNAECFVDGDGDGVGSNATVISGDDDCTDPGEAATGGDCNDADAGVNPGSAEIPDNGVDENCDGVDSITCFADADGDGVGTSTTVISDDDDCTDPGESDQNTDCNDGDPSVAPGTSDTPDDGIDQDCSGTDSVTCFADADGDGAGGSTTVVSEDDDCLDSGEAPTSTDCNDQDAGVAPGATEVPDDGVDQDCNGSDAATCFADVDGDGFGSGTLVSPDADCTDPGEATVGGDCDDGNALINPGAAEVPSDGIDQNCDGVDAAACFVDGDNDGFGSNVLMISNDGDCNDPGEAAQSGDCNDANATIFPGASETPADGIDQDCNGVDAVVCLADEDGDGAGGTETVVSLDGDCTDPGESDVGGDCDDDNGAIFPGATEVPGNGLDDDCDGFDNAQCYVDADGDGFGGDTGVVSSDDDCTDPGESATNDDCDDGDDSVSPGATEVPGDGIDQDCSGTDSVTCFVDADGDGVGTQATTVSSDDDCTDEGEAVISGDCNDANASIYLGAPEVGEDGIDQDCNGVDAAICFEDADGDLYGSTTTVLGLDGDCTDPGESTVDLDCDDSRPDVFPGAFDWPGDGVDQDCNGVDSAACFVDADGDGFGTRRIVVGADGTCNAPGQSDNSDDCDDSDPLTFPGADEIPNDGMDQDCDGVDAILCFVDMDGDNYGGPDLLVSPDPDCDDPGEAFLGGDCDDDDANVFPGADEIPGNGVDEDCDGFDNAACFVDFDNDGYGAGEPSLSSDDECSDPGESPMDGDCDDTDDAINPGTMEIPGDGIDQDCQGGDGVVCFFDADMDGVGGTATINSSDGDCSDLNESASNDDCNDVDATIFPGAPETPTDGIDQDCNGADAITCYLDDDDDGFGAGAAMLELSGTCAAGKASTAGDCDDSDDMAFPGAAETPGNGVDENCDGFDNALCFLDADMDGFGGPIPLLSGDDDCADAGGESAVSTDCADNDPTTYPGAPDPGGDGIDQDCDGQP